MRLGKNGEARPVYERALAATSDGKKKRPLLKKLVDLALLNDRGLDAKAALAEARTYHDELVKLDPRDDDARREWAEALAAHGQPGEAAAEWRTLAVGLSRDPARQGQAWLRAGELAEAAGDDKEARAAYDKTWALAPKGNYLRRESADKIVGLARKHDTLRTLTGEWERAWPEGGRGFAEWELLGRLYDELGDAEKAQGDFKRALALDPHALDARRRLIALYERTGRDAEALAEVRRLIASAPGEARFRLELAERLMKAGSRDEALKVAQAVGRESTDPSLHAQLAELYARWNLADPAMREQELLVRLEPADDSHLVALGELWWQKGNKKRALELWKRILVSGSARTEGRGPKVAAMARLAEVYVEHDMAPEALDLFQKAAKLAPDDVTVQKGIGSTLERLHRDAEAQDIWEALFARAAAKHDRAAQLEARQRLLVIAQRGGRLGIVAGQYRDAALRARNTDEEEAAAYTLHRRRCAGEDGAHGDGRGAPAWPRRYGAVARAARRCVDGPGAGRARAPQARRRAGGAEEGGRAHARARPRALSADRRAVAAALSGRRCARATPGARCSSGRPTRRRRCASARCSRSARTWSARRRRTSARSSSTIGSGRSTSRWRGCASARGEEARAAELYRTVMRRAPDEEMVIDAARRAIDLEEYLGTLGELERELSPLAYAHADKPVYRNLLIELYDRYGTPLVARAQAPGDGDACGPSCSASASTGCARCSTCSSTASRTSSAWRWRCSAPSAIRRRRRRCSSSRSTRQACASTKIAPAPFELRELGALAAAEVATARELPLLQKLFGEPEKQLRVAAAYGYGRLADKRARGAARRPRSTTAPSTCRRWPAWRSAPTPTAAPSTPWSRTCARRRRASRRRAWLRLWARRRGDPHDRAADADRARGRARGAGGHARRRRRRGPARRRLGARRRRWRRGAPAAGARRLRQARRRPPHRRAGAEPPLAPRHRRHARPAAAGARGRRPRPARHAAPRSGAWRRRPRRARARRRSSTAPPTAPPSPTRSTTRSLATAT